MDWMPTLPKDVAGPVYLRIADAIAADVGSGRLRRGQQLPTHRALASALGLDLTTITRAYAEAHRRGLTEARVGLGTFVSDTGLRPPESAAPGIQFDLSMNLPPFPAEADLDRRIAMGLAAIQREHGFTAYLNYQQPGGNDDERSAAAAWLRGRIPGASADRMVIFPGSQTALFCLLLAHTKPGDVVLTEELTFPGMKAAAAQTGVRLVSVATDGAGLIPDALDAAIVKHSARAVFLIPTLHNPTTVTMPAQRRVEIAEVIRARGVFLWEDDAYGPLVPQAKPIAGLVPALTFHAVTLSKCIAPGLRISYLLCPDAAAAERMTGTLRATSQMTSPLMRGLTSRWLKDGTADAIITAVRKEAIARQKLAAQILAGLPTASHPEAHHIWVTLPDRWGRAEFASHIHARGLAIVSSETFAVDTPPPHAIRVCLGAARNRAELVQALEVLSSGLRSSGVVPRTV